MQNFNPTPQTVIANTIGREYEKPRLKPPVFKVELAKPKETLSLKDILETLSKDNGK